MWEFNTGNQNCIREASSEIRLSVRERSSTGVG